MLLANPLRKTVAACLPAILGAAVLAQAPAAGATTVRVPAVQGGSAHRIARLLTHQGASPPGRLLRPARLLGPGWRRSPDRAVVVAGDATGLHVLAAWARDGYTWRTVATLSVRGADTPEWIGQACVTGSGRYAVVVYAPRQITNMAAAQGFAGLAAIVNLDSGRVVPLSAGVSVAYFDPGCGTGEDAVLTQSDGADGAASTRLITVNAPTGKITADVRLAGQVTSAVPYRGQVAAVRGGELVSIGSRGQVHSLAPVTGQAFRLVPDAAGGLGYLVASGGHVYLHRYAAGHDTLLGSARLGSVELSQNGGKVWVTGPGAARLGRLPAWWRALSVAPQAQISTSGALAITAVATPLSSKSRSPLASAPDSAQPVSIRARAAATGKAVAFTVPAAPPPVGGGLASAPLAASGAGSAAAAVAPAPGRHRASSATNPATVTYDPDRTCSVPRNDPKRLVYQPSPAQEEWAVDQGVRGDLTVKRGPDLYGSGLPAYTPQGRNGIFPLPGLTGGGRVPAQVMLGVLAQESAEYQASFHVINGQAGNPEVGLGWYGDTNPNAHNYVDWAKADCGYGTAQITTGMCMAGNRHCGSNNSPFPPGEQAAVAIDYQANIAAGLRILEQKWNEVYSHGIKANAAKTQPLENWWFALWDYNSGYHPPGTGTPASAHGLGWFNNPVNPQYPPDREMFLSANYNFDIAHPQNWSYEEKVIGFAAYGLFRFDFASQKSRLAFALGAWPAGNAPAAEPPHSLFCNGTDNCTPSAAQPCQLSSSDCWWHEPASWDNNCSGCGTEVLSYGAGAGDPGYPKVPPGYPPACSKGPLPANTVIVGDVVSSIPKPLGCGESWHNNGGTMTWNFAAASTTPLTYPSKVDFHQIGAGYSGHFWFAHAISAEPAARDLRVTGTWRPPASVTGWTRIMVSIPNYGAWDPEATYEVSLGNGSFVTRVVNQAWQSNTWVDLGIFRLSKGASLSLSNVTALGLGDDIAWGAAAFIHVPQPGASYVAMGDSYSAGEGVQPFDPDSDYNNNGLQDACHRSTGAYSRMVTLPGQSKPVAEQAKTLTGNTQFAFIACSGDITTGITENADDRPPTSYDAAGNTDWGSTQFRFNELPQADQRWLGAGTTLVTLSIGGNDARFADVLTGCILTITDCTSSGYHLTRASNGAVDPKPLIEFEPIVIGLLKNHLEAVFSTIHKLAPKAGIIVLGYPRLFPTPPPSNGCDIGLGLTLGADDATWMNQTGTFLNQTIGKAVKAVAAKGVHIHFIDPTKGFAGHEICSSDSWINGLVAWSVSGSGRKFPGAGSFHPKAAGQREYAALVDKCLAGKLPSDQGTC